MKTIIAFVTVLLAVATAAAAIPSAVDDLVGSWRTQVGDIQTKLTFHRSGEFSGRVVGEKFGEWHFRGKWNVENGRIYYTYTESSRSEIPVGTKDEDEIVEITPTYFEIRNQGEGRIRYERVEEGQPNQALQTTQMTRSVYEKTMEFGHRRRGV